jgi:uncharacterized protein (TIGR02145 family)
MIIIGVLLLATPALRAQDFLQKAKKFLDAGDCEKAQMAYDAYKVENPGGNADVEKGIAQCWKKVDSLQALLDGQPCPGTPTVTDYDGHTYNTVQIGKQCWMKENLRTERYADGTEISYGVWNTSTTKGYRYNPNNSELYVKEYGYLYNWKAVMGNSSSSNANPSRVQGICLDGWHVPSDAEWLQLTDYVASQSRYVCGNKKNSIGKALASNSKWKDGSYTTGENDRSNYIYFTSSDSHKRTACSVCNNQKTNNATGFTALPAGRKIKYDHGTYYFGGEAYFWSATEVNDEKAIFYYLYTNYEEFIRDVYGGEKSYSYSVRCVRD